MVHNSQKIGYACFGTRNGFEHFSEKGLMLQENKALRNTFYQKIKLESKIRQSIANSKPHFYASHRFQDRKNNDYIIVGMYQFTLDAFSRDGYVGAAMIFKNCYPSIDGLSKGLKDLLKFSIEQHQSKEKLVTEEISIPVDDYEYDFSLYSPGKKLIDIEQSDERFLTKLFWNHLGTNQSVYYSGDYELFNCLSGSKQFDVSTYDDLNAETTNAWEAEVFKNRAESDKLTDLISKLRGERLSLNREKKNLERSNKKTLQEIETNKKLLSELKRKQKELIKNIELKKKELSQLQSSIDSKLEILKKNLNIIDSHNQSIKEALHSIRKISEGVGKQGEVIG